MVGNPCECELGVEQHLVIGETDDGHADGLQVLGTGSVLGGYIRAVMNGAIDLDNQSDGRNEEIDNEGPDRLLSANFDAQCSAS